MSVRSRFPARPSRTNVPKVRVPYRHTNNNNTATLQTDYSQIAAQTATNLKAFRSLFGSSGEV